MTAHVPEDVSGEEVFVSYEGDTDEQDYTVDPADPLDGEVWVQDEPT